MENQVQPVKPSDEIDLIELFNRIGASFKRFFKSIFKTSWDVLFFVTKFFYRNTIPIGLFTITGFVIGLALFFSGFSKDLSSEMVASSNSLRNDEMINYINNLNELCKAGNKVDLGKFLNLELTTASKITSIKALWSYDRNRDGLPDFIDYKGTFEIKATDTIQKRLWDRFYVKATSTDPSVFSKLQEGIKTYVNSNLYIKELNDNRKTQQKAMITEIDNEIKKLDSLQKFEYFQKNRIVPQVSANQMVLFTEKDRRLYHKDIFELFNQKQSLEKSLAVAPDPITVIQDFTVSKDDSNINLTTPIKFAIFGFILGTLIMFIRIYGRKIHNALVTE